MTIQNREMEAALLGAIIRRNSLYQTMAEIVQPEQFTWECYRWAWESMAYLHEKNFTIDAVTLGDELERREKLNVFMNSDAAGGFFGRAALGELRQMGDPQHAESYAIQIQNYAVKRHLLELSAKLGYWSANGREAKDILNDITQELAAVNIHGKATSRTVSIVDALSLATDKTIAASTGKTMAIKTGLVDFDKLTGGLHQSDFILIAGRPGLGKTALGMTIALNAANDGKKVCIFSLEMSADQLANRLLAQVSGIENECIRDGKMTDDEWVRYDQAHRKIGKLAISINDATWLTISEIKQETRKIAAQLGGLDLWILDYIQLAAPDKKSERRQIDLGEVSRGVKAIAREMNIPCVAMAQLSRAIESRSDKTPQLSDLREAGDLEQDSDMIVFLSEIPSDSLKSTIKTTIPKHRNGRTGEINLYFNKPITKYENSARIPQNPPA